MRASDSGGPSDRGPQEAAFASWGGSDAPTLEGAHFIAGVATHSSCKMNSDAALALHISDSVLLAGAACGHPPRERRVAPAALLPPSRSPPLRHVHAHGRHEGPGRIGQTLLHRSRNLPLVPRLHSRTCIDNSRAGRLPGQVAGSARAASLTRRRPRRCPPETGPHPRRPRTSRHNPRLENPVECPALLKSSIHPVPD